MFAKLVAMSLILCPGWASADYIQLLNDNRQPIHHTTVSTQDGRVLGFTDKYGRMVINGPPMGVRMVKFSYGGQEKLVRISIDGGNSLKVIRVQ